MAETVAQKRAALPLADNRPEAVAQRKLQGMMSNSPRVQEGKASREMTGKPAAGIQITTPASGFAMQRKVNINDDKGLEKEADTMGSKALAIGAAAPEPLTANTVPHRARTPGINLQSAPLQAKYILRNGKRVWVDDSHVLQPGEEPLPSGFHPRVIFNKGKSVMTYDSSGTTSVEKAKSKPPTHKELQKTRKKQGKELRSRLKRRAVGDLQKDVSQLDDLAGQLEEHAGDSAPKNHKNKVRKLHKEGDITGPKFRNMIKGKDEFTESEATASFLEGLGTSAGDTPPHYSQMIDDYEETTLRAMSSLRAPTNAIIAPIEHSGNVTGQQHPTETSIPKLSGGSSGHAYADRHRVHEQNQAFKLSAEDTSAPPNALLFTSLLASGSSTLSGMSHPLSASNVPDFDTSMHDDQHKNRERIKKQVNTVAKALSIPVSQEEADFDAPLTAHKTPTSPKRLDKAETLARKLKAASKTPTATPVSTSASTQIPSSPVKTSSKPVLKKVKETQDHLVESVNRVINTIRQTYVNHPWITARINALNAIITHAQQADLTTQQSEQVLLDLYTPLNTLFHQLEPYLGRGLTAAGGDANSDYGNRIASLEQYMAECGQMAVHNLDAFEHAQANNDFGNLNTGLGNEQNLRGHGNFENNIGEDQIRQMLATANRQGVPVIGNLGQLQNFVNQYNTAQNIGSQYNVANFGAQWLASQWHQGPVEIAEIQNMNHFVRGTSNEINFIINTDAHHQIAAGTHWITVRLERADNGQIRIFYTDSLRGINYYPALFQALRAFVNSASAQNAQQNAPVSKKSVTKKL